ncbi:hypothetical protein KFU94_42605 [Chloroflexi bacterium TSY]|nr:hypothetical protein [Chloroflexi bacterium TSY]
MPQLKLQLFGPPLLERDGTPFDVGRRKAVALLAYLVTTGRIHSRDALAAFFWPEHDQSSARTDLRRMLSVLNRNLGQGILASDRETVSLALKSDSPASSEPALWLDVAEFRHSLHACQTHDHPIDQVCTDCLPLLDAALRLYRDDFLAGFTLRDSPDFDDWQYFEGEGLRQELASALEKLVKGHSAHSEFGRAIGYARRWLALDPLHEPAHRHLMQLYAWTDRHTAARRQYEQCMQMLVEELGMSPSAETQALDAAIRAGHLQPPESIVPALERETDAPRITDIQKAVQRPSENELRLVTVLCVGLVEGGSVLEMSPEQTATQMAQLTDLLLPILDRYEARLERLVGESILTFFGAERIHEDDAERSLRVALELMDVAQGAGLTVAAGVASGPVFVGQVGDRLGTQITGPVVTLATRLQGAADADEVLVSQSLRQRTHHAFRLESLQVQMRGLSGSVYQLLRPRRQPRKTRGIEGLRADLIGRHEELTKLVWTTQQVQEGEGQIVCLIGDAGVGKSRLVSELQLKFIQPSTQGTPATSTQPPAPHQLLWLEGRCQEMGWMDI